MNECSHSLSMLCFAVCAGARLELQSRRSEPERQSRTQSLSRLERANGKEPNYAVVRLCLVCRQWWWGGAQHIRRSVAQIRLSQHWSVAPHTDSHLYLCRHTHLCLLLCVVRMVCRCTTSSFEADVFGPSVVRRALGGQRWVAVPCVGSRYVDG